MHPENPDVPLWSILPFICLLGCIALLPLKAPHWWEHNKNKGIVAGLLALPVAAWLLSHQPEALLHSMHEYVSFIALLTALFVVAGGIHLAGDLRATPRTNTVLLGVGAVLANLLGTTGASMVLIRLVLRTNSERRHTEHLPFFFILVVSNCGGLLTPMGDPPLFLGYLRGVPFTWTLQLFPFWLLAIAWLLGLFFVLDRKAYARESLADIRRDDTQVQPMRLIGWRNIPLLFAVVGAIFLDSPLREGAMLALAAVSYFVSSRTALKENGFAFGPIIEVAVLFVGIFVTMVPALELLAGHGAELGLDKPWQYFLITGSLSSVLDNAPTYLTFLSAAQSLGLEPEVVGMPHLYLVAISVGAVFMGANTYIGNGPNFMVRRLPKHRVTALPRSAATH
jgi:Na+/H+ antiporter NhaD/arsenite permease-like protein